MKNALKERDLKVELLERKTQELTESNQDLKKRERSLKMTIVKKNVEQDRIRKLALRYGIDLNVQEKKTRNKKLDKARALIK